MRRSGRDSNPYTKGATLVSLLEERAEMTPGRPFIVMDGGDSRTYGRFNADANRLAHGLAGLGVASGDHVAVLLPNGLEALLATFALRKLGAVEISITWGMRGTELRRALARAQPRLVIVGDEFCDRFEDLGDALPAFGLVVRGDLATAERAFPGRRVIAYDSVATNEEGNLAVALPDTQVDAVLFTSGTTGPAKGCILSHRAGAAMGLGIARSLKLREEDCLYCAYPTTLVDSRYLTVGAALWTGGRAAIGRGFSADVFWEEIRNFEATVFEFMGSALTVLWNREAEAADLDNPARLGWGIPPPPFGPLFEERFGLRLATCYGSTDAGVPTWRDPDLRGEPFNSSGRVVEPFEIRIGGERDEPLATGEVGEILVRAEVADVTMKGYLGMPEETIETFRNGWLHTGDCGRLDVDGRLYVEGRMSESIRRHGKNVSSWEVEQALEAHPEVLEAAVVGLPAAAGEGEDVCAFLVLEDASELSAESLREFLRPRIAELMMPRVFAVVPEFPKTETGKTEKFRLTRPSVRAGRLL